MLLRIIRVKGAFLVRVIGQWDVSEAHCVF